MVRTKKRKSLVRALHRHAKDHFIPHKGNGHVPHALKHRTLFGFTLALILLKSLVITASIALPSASAHSSAITIQNIIELTNNTRRGLGLDPLKSNSKLAQAALAKANDMLAKQYFSHASPDGKTPWNFIAQAGYSYSTAGENLAVHYFQAEDVQAGWLASPTHRANIVNPKYKDVGIGIARGKFEGFDSIVVVQMFGAPRVSGTIEARQEEPAFDPLGVKIVLRGGVYTVQVNAKNARSVIAQLGNTAVKMERAPDGLWRGSVPSNTGGELAVMATSLEGRDEVSTAAIFMPGDRAQDLYSFGNDKHDALSFIGADGLRDQVGSAYLLTIFFLCICLLILLLASKTKMRHPKVVAHTLVVIALAAVLWRF